MCVCACACACVCVCVCVHVLVCVYTVGPCGHVVLAYQFQVYHIPGSNSPVHLFLHVCVFQSGEEGLKPGAVQSPSCLLFTQCCCGPSQSVGSVGNCG